MTARLTRMCIAALALSAVRGGSPPPPRLVMTGPFLRCPWSVSESLEVDGEPWWQSAVGDDSSPSWYEQFIMRRQGGAMLGPVFVPNASTDRVWGGDGWLQTRAGKHFTRLRDDALY